MRREGKRAGTYSIGNSHFTEGGLIVRTRLHYAARSVSLRVSTCYVLCTDGADNIDVAIIL